MPFFREIPAIEKDIKNIDNNDNKVRILGTVISRKDNALVIDDGTGTIDVRADKTDDISEGQKVRVFGRIANKTLFAEIIQDMTRLNIDLYNKAKDRWKDFW